ncbi:MAG: lipopolysaccharide biosynthesis protein [Burkholderiales bacterium]
MTLGHKIRNGASKVLAGSVSAQVLQLAFGIVLARLLAPADFGMIATISIFTGIVGYITGAGMGAALIQAKEVHSRDFHAVFTLQIGIALLIYGCFFVFAPAFGKWYATPLYADLLRVSALNFLLRPFVNLPNAKLSREMKYGISTLVNLGVMVVTGITSIVLAYSGLGVWALLLGGLTGNICNAIAASIAAKWAPRLIFRATSIRGLATYGFKVSANDFIGYLQSQMPAFLLSRFATQHDVGIYNKGASLSSSAGLALVGAAYGPLFRGLSSIQGNRDQNLYLFGRALAAVTTYALPVYIGIAWLSEPMVVLLFGEKWSESVPVVRLLASFGMLNILMIVSGAVIQAQNAVGREVIIQLQGLAVLTAGIFLGMNWGVVGVAAALAGFWLFASWRQMVLALHCVNGNFKFITSTLKEPLLLNAVLVLALSAGEGIRSFLYPTMSLLSYALGMIGLGGIAYILSFLYLPLRTLESETTRWKRLFRMAV